MKNVWCLICLVFLFSSCEDKLDVKVDDLTPRLVVEGYISDGDKPVEVLLTYTTSYGYNFAVPKVSGAIVCLFDNEGNCTDLREVEEGVYSSAGSQLEVKVGGSYAIEISLPNGRNYVSSPEMVQEPLGIDSAYFEYFKREEYGRNGTVELVPSVQFFADIPNPLDEQNYLLWKWNGTYEYLPPLMSIPKSCWILEEGMYSRFNLFGDENMETSQVRGLKIDYLDVDYRFNIKFVLEIQQYTIGAEAYNYFKSLKHQLDRSGSIFDPSPYRVVGNISNKNDPEEIVLGYFYAASLSKKHLRVKRVDIPLKSLDGGPFCEPPFFGGPPKECTSCETFPNQHSEPPVFW